MINRSFLLICLITTVLAGCSQQASNPPAPPAAEPKVGADRDAHGCIGSAGYLWCEAKKECVRPFELPKIEHEGTSTKERFEFHCNAK